MLGTLGRPILAAAAFGQLFRNVPNYHSGLYELLAIFPKKTGQPRSWVFN
jgi:hypothetical protein